MSWNLCFTDALFGLHDCPSGTYVLVIDGKDIVISIYPPFCLFHSYDVSVSVLVARCLPLIPIAAISSTTCKR